MSLTTLGKFKEKIHLGDDLLILDVRSRADYKSSHIPGAKSAPHESIDEMYIHCVPRSKTLIVYADDPDSEEPVAAARKLEDMGHWNVMIYRGGIREWNNAAALERN